MAVNCRACLAGKRNCCREVRKETVTIDHMEEEEFIEEMKRNG